VNYFYSSASFSCSDLALVKIEFEILLEVVRGGMNDENNDYYIRYWKRNCMVLASHLLPFVIERGKATWEICLSSPLIPWVT